MMKKIQQKNRLGTTKHTQQSCKQSRGWNASSDGCPIETTKVLWWGSYTLCPRHPTSAARRPAAPVLSGFVWKITSRFHGLSWFIMVYHGLSWFIMVYHGLSSLFWGYIMWWVPVYHAIHTTFSERYLEDQTIPYLGVTVSWSVERIGICLTKVVT